MFYSMEPDLKMLTDPLNNQVHLSAKFNQVLLLDECVDKDLSLTILKPSMVIVTKDNSNLYHTRS